MIKPFTEDTNNKDSEVKLFHEILEGYYCNKLEYGGYDTSKEGEKDGCFTFYKISEECYTALISKFGEDGIESVIDNVGNLSFLLVEHEATNTAPLEFYHICTASDLKEIIEGEGLKAHKTSIGDLGPGVYVVEDTVIGPGMDNLCTYIEDTFYEMDNDSMKNTHILIVTGKYTGTYWRCELSPSDITDHLGYILLKDNVPPEQIEAIEDITVYDYLHYF